MTKKQAQLAYQKTKRIDNFAKKLLKEKELLPAFRITLFQLLRDTKVALSFWAAQKKQLAINNPKITGSNKLQIGGGKRYIEGFVNLDIIPPADIIWDCRYGLPFEKNKFSFIFSEHFFEHVDFPISAKKILGEMYRILKPGGEMVIGVPDGGKVVRAYYEKDKKFLNKLQESSYARRNPPVELHGDIDLVNYLFRDQLDNPDYTVHYWAYDETSLKNFLKSVGFKKVERYPFNPLYCNPKREFFTLFIKATK